MKKLIDKDPFSTGTEQMRFDDYNCSKCVKSSEPREDKDGRVYYTNAREDNMPRCSIQRDIMTRMFRSEPIKEETVRICDDFIYHGTLCPYMRTEHKKCKNKENKSQLSIF